MWTDSECVIKQLNDMVTCFKVYFYNRISEIQALTDMSEWRWVPSGENPADNCTHGLLARDSRWQRFHNGPEYLLKDEKEWPEKQITSEPFPAHILATVVTMPAVVESWISKISRGVASWSGKIQRIALFEKTILRCVVKRRHNTEDGAALRAMLHELRDAEMLLIRDIQQRHFSEEVKVLAATPAKPTKRHKVHAKSEIVALNPFVDKLDYCVAWGVSRNHLTS